MPRRGRARQRLEGQRTASCPTAAASASPARCTSPAPTTRSTRTRCRRRASSSSSTAPGCVTVFTGGNDIGQGSNSVAAYLVAEELGLRARARARRRRRHRPVPGRPRRLLQPRARSWSATPRSTPAASCARRSSRRVAEAWEVAPTRVRMLGGQVVDLEDPARSIPTRRGLPARRGALRHAGRHGLLQHARRSAATTAAARSAPRRPTRSPRTSSRCEVDVETGRVDVRDASGCAHDCGRALNPMLVEGQIEGSAYMGFAEALLEEHDVNRFGLHAGPSLLDYRIPTSLDTPEIERADRREPSTPRAPTAPRRPARARCTRRSRRIANAIFDAVGVRLRAPAVHARAGCCRPCARRARGRPSAPRAEAGADAAPARGSSCAARARVAEAVALLAEAGPTAVVIAGGTDLLPNMKHELVRRPSSSSPWPASPSCAASRVDEDGTLVIGAMTTLAELAAERAGARARARRWPRPRGLVAGPQLRDDGHAGRQRAARHALPVDTTRPTSGARRWASASRRTARSATWSRAARSASRRPPTTPRRR